MALYSNPHLKGRYFPDHVETALAEASAPPSKYGRSSSPEQQANIQAQLRSTGLTDENIHVAEAAFQSKFIVSSPEKNAGPIKVTEIHDHGSERGEASADDIAQKIVFDALHRQHEEQQETTGRAVTLPHLAGEEPGSIVTNFEDAYHPKTRRDNEKRRFQHHTKDDSSSDEGYGDISKGFSVPQYSMVTHSVFQASAASPGSPSVAVSVQPKARDTSPGAYGEYETREEANADQQNHAVRSSPPRVPPMQQDRLSLLANQDNDYAEPVEQGTEAVLASADLVAASANTSPSRHTSSSSVVSPSRAPTPSPKRSTCEVKGTPGTRVEEVARVDVLTTTTPMPSPMAPSQKQGVRALANQDNDYAEPVEANPIVGTTRPDPPTAAPSARATDSNVRAMIEQSLNAMQHARELLRAPTLKSVIAESEAPPVPVVSARPTVVLPTTAMSTALVTTGPAQPVSRVRKLRKQTTTVLSTENEHHAQTHQSRVPASTRTAITASASSGKTATLKSNRANVGCPSAMSSCRRRHLTTALRDQGAGTPMIEHVVRGSSLDGGSMDERGMETTSGTTLTPISSDSEGNGGEFSLADDSTGAERTPQGLKPIPATFQEVSPSSSSSEAEEGELRQDAVAPAVAGGSSPGPQGLPPRSGEGSPNNSFAQIPKYDFSPVTPQELNASPKQVDATSSPGATAGGTSPSTLATSGLKAGVGLALLQQQQQREKEQQVSHDSVEVEVDDDHRFPPTTVPSPPRQQHREPMVVHSSVPVELMQKRPPSPTKVVATAPTPASASVTKNLMARGPLQLTSGAAHVKPAWSHSAPVKAQSKQSNSADTAAGPLPRKHHSRSPPNQGTPRYLLPTSSWEAKGVALRSAGGTRRRRSGSPKKSSPRPDQSPLELEAQPEHDHEFHHCHHAAEHGGDDQQTDGRWPYPLAKHRDPHHPPQTQEDHVEISAGVEHVVEPEAEQDEEQAQHDSHQAGAFGGRTSAQFGTWDNKMMHVGRYKQDLGTFNRHAETIRQRQMIHESKKKESERAHEVQFRQVGAAPLSASGPRQVVGVSQLARMVTQSS